MRVYVIINMKLISNEEILLSFIKPISQTIDFMSIHLINYFELKTTSFNIRFVTSDI